MYWVFINDQVPRDHECYSIRITLIITSRFTHGVQDLLSAFSVATDMSRFNPTRLSFKSCQRSKPDWTNVPFCILLHSMDNLFGCRGKKLAGRDAIPPPAKEMQIPRAVSMGITMGRTEWGPPSFRQQSKQ